MNPHPTPGPRTKPLTRGQELSLLVVQKFYPTGNERVLDPIWTETRKGTLAYIASTLGVRDINRAEDLMQDVFAKALRGLREGKFVIPEDAYHNPPSIFTWLSRIAHNEFINAYRKGTKDPAKPSKDEDPFVVVGFEHAERPAAAVLGETDAARDLILSIHEFMGQMGKGDPAYKPALVMQCIWFDGMSYEQAAEALQMPIGSVRSNLHRAKMQTQEFLAKRGITETPDEVKQGLGELDLGELFGVGLRHTRVADRLSRDFKDRSLPPKERKPYTRRATLESRQAPALPTIPVQTSAPLSPEEAEAALRQKYVRYKYACREKMPHLKALKEAGLTKQTYQLAKLRFPLLRLEGNVITERPLDPVAPKAPRRKRRTPEEMAEFRARPKVDGRKTRSSRRLTEHQQAMSEDAGTSAVEVVATAVPYTSHHTLHLPSAQLPQEQTKRVVGFLRGKMLEAFESGEDANAETLRGAWRILKADLPEEAQFAPAQLSQGVSRETPVEEPA